MMTRIGVAILILVAVVGPAAGYGTTGSVGASPSDATPGATLSGALEVHETDLESEIASRSLVVALDRATQSETPAKARAAVIASRLTITRQRIRLLEQRRETLAEARASGAISEWSFRVRSAAIAAEARAHDRQLQQSLTHVDTLPPSIRTAYNLSNVSISTMRSRTALLSHPDYDLVGFDSWGVTGWNESRWSDYRNQTMEWNTSLQYWNVSSELATRLDRDEGHLDSLSYNYTSLDRYADGDDPEVQDALACTRDALENATTAVAVARSAARRGNETAVRSRLRTAEAAFEQATDCLERGWRAARADETTKDGDSTRSGDSPSETWTPTKSSYSDDSG